MIKKLKRLWVLKVRWPLLQRRMRNGIVAIMWANQQLIRAKAPRQFRRQLIRDLQRDPNKMVHLLPWLYPEV